MGDNGGMVSPVSDSETLTEAWRLQQLGVDTMNVGKFAEAVDIFCAALKLVGWEENTSFTAHRDYQTVVARVLISRSFAESQQGRHTYGWRLLDAAEPLTAAEHRGILVQTRAVVMSKAGRISEAIDYFTEAEPLLEKHGPVLSLIALLINRSVSYAELGRMSSARGDLQRCEALCTEHDFPVMLVKATHSRGNIELYSGNIPEALSLYDAAERLYEAHAPELVSEVRLNRAQALVEAGLLREAAVLCDQIMEDYQQSGRTWWALAVVAIQRARIALAIETPEAGLRAAEHAEAKAREIGSAFSVEYAHRLRREAQLQTGRIPSDFVAETLALAQRIAQLGIPEDADTVRILAGRVLISQGRYEEAETCLRRSNHRDSLEGHGFLVLRRLAWAELHMARGDRSAALTQLRSGLNRLHHYRSRLGSVELQAGMASLGRRLAEKGVGIVVDHGRPHTIFSWAERSKAQAFRVTPVSPPEDSAMSELVARVRRSRNELRENELIGEPVDELRALCRKWERRLREHSWQSSGTGESVPLVRPRQVHDQLGDRALISYFTDRDRLHALTLAGGVTRHVRLGPVAEVAEAARRIAADLAAATGRRLPERMLDVVRRSIRHQADRLGRALLEPLATHIGDRELVVVPTQALSSLPWGLLPSLAGRPMSVSPSASVWWSAEQRVRPVNGRTMLASGPGLMHAEAELDALARYHPDSRVLRGDTATADDVLAGLDGASLAHLAAHGYHEPENVLFSRLDFASGPLMAYDIVRLAVPPAHVTLSACDVGRSTVSVGDETLGFTAALLHAGTSTVISSVTKVEHKAAVDVMTAYHAALVEGAAPARALAEASQRQPFASFVCYGAG